MDAHTLNAWTRFALQKGGIGKCTALIDNPATDQDDLMFMTGEEIIVLRRLDEDESGVKRRSGMPDADSWFLGYCEGVVGRFKGAHVQFHGKLKKPVLMRRSGVGSVRDASTRPMSKSDLFNMHVSQVPPGMPITAVNSDGEEGGSSSSGHQYRQNGSNGHGSVAAAPGQHHRTDPVSAASAALNGYRGMMATTPTKASYSQGLTSNCINRAGLGITTPPLSDETHRRTGSASHLGGDDEDGDQSEESESALPWARRSIASSTEDTPSQSLSESAITASHAASVGSNQQTQRNHNQHQQRYPGGGGGVDGQAGLTSMAHLNTAILPPSPISSNESPIHRRSNDGGGANGLYSSSQYPSSNGYGGPGGAGRPRAHGHTSKSLSGSSSRSNATTDSEDADDSAAFQRRRDYTFSIYDVYGRDSVAFPNFSLDDAAAAGGGIVPAAMARTQAARQLSRQQQGHAQQRASGSLSGSNSATASGAGLASAVNHLTLNTRDANAAAAAAAAATSSADPITPRPLLFASDAGAGAGSVKGGSGAPSSATSAGLALWQAGAKRPNAPPPLDGMQLPPQPQASLQPSQQQQQASLQQGPVFGFDPRRRPSAQAGNGPGGLGLPPSSTTNRAQDIPSPTQSSFRPLVSSGLGSGPGGPGGLAPLSTSPGTGPSGPGMSGGYNNSMRSPYGSLAPGSNGGRSSVQPGEPHGRVSSDTSRSIGGASSPGFPPTRSSSDRTSIRERGSFQLKKNPSNPFPSGTASNAAGSSSNLSITPNSISRSPSPSLLATSPGAHSASGGFSSPGLAPGTPNSAHFRQRIPSPGPPPGSALGPETPTGPMLGQNGMPLKFDSLGFIAGTSPDFPAPREDSEAKDKWMQVLQENDLAAARKSRKVKKMVRDGIPASMRGRVWLFLANSSVRRRPGLFEMLCKQSQAAKGRKGKEEAYDAIEKDVGRSFPDHQLFIGENSTGRADLEAILKAYVHFNPFIGYTQGMGLIAGIFMLQMPPEDAFWMLCALLREPHMEGYFSGNLKQLHVDGVVFARLLQHMDPQLQSRLSDLGIDASHFAPNWFLPLFVRVLPWQTLLRVWDVFFFEGPVWLLRVGLALIRICRDVLMDSSAIPDHGEALRVLLHPPQHLSSPDNVLSCALSAKLKDGEVRKLSRNASKLVRQDLSGGGERGRASSREENASRSTSAPARPRA